MARGERRDRETSKISCGVSGEKNPHTRKHSQPQLPENAVFASGNAVSPSAFPRQQLYTARHCSGASRVTAVTRTRCHAPLALTGPGTNISTDRLLWTVKPKEFYRQQLQSLFLWPLLPQCLHGKDGMPQSIPSEVQLTKTALQSQSQNMSFPCFWELHLFKLSSWSIKLLTSSF